MQHLLHIARAIVLVFSGLKKVVETGNNSRSVHGNPVRDHNHWRLQTPPAVSARLI